MRGKESGGMKKSQFKTDIHQIFLLTKRNFSDWGKSPRIWMTFALGFVLCLMLTNQILEQAQTFHNMHIPDAGAGVGATDLDLR